MNDYIGRLKLIHIKYPAYGKTLIEKMKQEHLEFVIDLQDLKKILIFLKKFLTLKIQL